MGLERHCDPRRNLQRNHSEASRGTSVHGEALRLSECATAVRESTLIRLLRVPAGFENWSPAEQALSFADIAQHLIDADHWLFAKLANPGLAGMKAVAGSGQVADRAGFLAILERLRVVGEERREVIARLSNADLDTPFFDDRFGCEVAAWWIIVRGNFEHEAQHRGQVASYLRIIGSPWR